MWLRGLSIPAGRHNIPFLFHPQAYYLGRQLEWMANIILLLLIVPPLSPRCKIAISACLISTGDAYLHNKKMRAVIQRVSGPASASKAA